MLTPPVTLTAFAIVGDSDNAPGSPSDADRGQGSEPLHMRIVLELDHGLEAPLKRHPDAALIRSLSGMGPCSPLNWSPRQVLSRASAPPTRWPPPAATSASSTSSSSPPRPRRPPAFYNRKRRGGKMPPPGRHRPGTQARQICSGPCSNPASHPGRIQNSRLTDGIRLHFRCTSGFFAAVSLTTGI